VLKEDLKNIFLQMDEDEKGKEILSQIYIDEFITVDDSLYDNVRKMDAWVKLQNEKP
ncbi:MAG: PhnD/SsuA/transferrin family substrate-binding protein, partial [Methanosarcinales archaeon]